MPLKFLEFETDNKDLSKNIDDFNQKIEFLKTTTRILSTQDIKDNISGLIELYKQFQTEYKDEKSFVACLNEFITKLERPELKVDDLDTGLFNEKKAEVYLFDVLQVLIIKPEEKFSPHNKESVKVYSSHETLNEFNNLCLSLDKKTQIGTEKDHELKTYLIEKKRSIEELNRNNDENGIKRLIAELKKLQDSPHLQAFYQEIKALQSKQAGLFTSEGQKKADKVLAEYHKLGIVDRLNPNSKAWEPVFEAIGQQRNMFKIGLSSSSFKTFKEAIKNHHSSNSHENTDPELDSTTRPRKR